MFYFLSKTIDFLLMPFSISLLLLLYGSITKSTRRKRISLIFSFLILFCISNSYLINKAFYWWEYKPVNLSEVTKTYDAGIVLSGGLASLPEFRSDHASLGLHADRFLQAYLLYKQGKIKKIIITGTSPEYLLKHEKGEVQLAAQLLIKWGVKQEDIILEIHARNTRENALFTAKILNTSFPKGKYLLITSAFHMLSLIHI